MTSWPLPRPDLDSQPFWDGLVRREIRVQRCADCGRLRFPPRAACWSCGSSDLSWEACSGRANLVTWTVTHHPFGAAFRELVPYTVLLVHLAEQEDLLMYGNLRGADPGELHVGQTFQAEFETVSDEVTLLQWRPVSG